jgi:hypothetical protein
MARIFDDKLFEDFLREWGDGRPQIIIDLARRFPINRLYRLKETGHIVTITSYNEESEFIVFVGGDLNFLTMERFVFGIKTSDLEECDWPEEGTMVGAPNIGFKRFKRDEFHMDERYVFPEDAGEIKCEMCEAGIPHPHNPEMN